MGADAKQSRSNQGKSTETSPYYVCPYCGNTVEKEPLHHRFACSTRYAMLHGKKSVQRSVKVV